MHLNVPTECPICGEAEETIEHLFFNCEFARKCWQCNFAGHMDKCSSLQQFNDWMQRPGGNKFRQQVVQCLGTAVIYAIWQQRNRAIWECNIENPRYCMQTVRQHVFWRISNVLPRKTTLSDREWLCRMLS